MWLNIQTHSSSASRITYLLHKHPGTLHVKEWSQVKAWLYFFSHQRTSLGWTVLLKPLPHKHTALFNPISPAHFSIALNKFFSSAMNGVSDEADDLVDQPFLWTVQFGATDNKQFQILLSNWLEKVPGYKHHFLHNGTIDFQIACPLKQLLKMIYVFFIAADQNNHLVTQLDSRAILFEKGKAWLEMHPDQQAIENLFLKNDALPSIPYLLLESIDRITPFSKWLKIGNDPFSLEHGNNLQESRHSAEYPPQPSLEPMATGNLFVWQPELERCTHLLFVIASADEILLSNSLTKYQWWVKHDWQQIYVLSEIKLSPSAISTGKHWQLSIVLEEAPFTLYLLNDLSHAA